MDKAFSGVEVPQQSEALTDFLILTDIKVIQSTSITDRTAPNMPRREMKAMKMRSIFWLRVRGPFSLK